MSQQENDIKHYGAEDLERYHSGKMTAKEMHALEKAALDDPFLSDALDGYANSRTALPDINELKKRLLQKEAENKVVPFKKKIPPLLKIAAVLVLFAGLSWLLYENNSSSNNEIATDNDLLKEVQAPAVTETTTDTIPKKEAESLVAVQDTKDAGRERIASLLRSESNNNTSAKEIASADDKTKLTLAPTSVVTINDSLNAGDASYYAVTTPAQQANVDNALAGKVAGLEVKTQNATTLNTVKGRVTNNKGEPVAYATIIDKKNNQAISADGEGSFAFTTNDSAPEVNVNAVGYKSVIQELRNNVSANNVVLNEADSRLNEVVVTGAFGTKRTARSTASNVIVKNKSKEEASERVSITNAIPIKGWQDFNDYVRDSLKTIEQLGPASVSAEVLVSFDVNKNGEAIDIQVKKSLCTACDAKPFASLRTGRHGN